MSEKKIYQPPNPSVGALLQTLGALPGVDGLYGELLTSSAAFERICLDRYLLIWNSLRELRLYDCSILDLGCASGFFSFSLAVTTASQVTAVEDARAAVFDYGPEAFLAPLLRDCEKNGLRHVEVVADSIEKFLGEADGNRQWDAVLCLGVLHHFHTGYGDHPEIGRMSAEELLKFYRRLGNVTRNVLYLCVDTTRIADTETFLGELCGAGGFGRPKLLGWSCSATGQRRPLWEIRKSHG